MRRRRPRRLRVEGGSGTHSQGRLGGAGGGAARCCGARRRELLVLLETGSGARGRRYLRPRAVLATGTATALWTAAHGWPKAHVLAGGPEMCGGAAPSAELGAEAGCLGMTRVRVGAARRASWGSEACACVRRGGCSPARTPQKPVFVIALCVCGVLWYLSRLCVICPIQRVHSGARGNACMRMLLML